MTKNEQNTQDSMEKVNRIKDQICDLLGNAGAKEGLSFNEGAVILFTILLDVHQTVMMNNTKNLIKAHERYFHHGSSDKTEGGNPGGSMVDPEPQKPHKS